MEDFHFRAYFGVCKQLIYQHKKLSTNITLKEVHVLVGPVKSQLLSVASSPNCFAVGMLYSGDPNSMKTFSSCLSTRFNAVILPNLCSDHVRNRCTDDVSLELQVDCLIAELSQE